MKKTIRIILSALLVVLPISVYAAQSTSIQIERIGIQDDGIVILYAKNGWGSVANNSCSSGTGVLAFRSTTDGGKALLSAALMAYAAQKVIVVNTYETVCLPVGGMAPSIQRIDTL